MIYHTTAWRALHCAGCVPALDTGSEVVPAPKAGGDLAAAAALVGALLSTGVADLDSWLSPPQRAERLAFATLLSSRLEPASQFTTWLEPRGFREFRKVRVCACVHTRVRAPCGPCTPPPKKPSTPPSPPPPLPGRHKRLEKPNKCRMPFPSPFLPALPYCPCQAAYGGLPFPLCYAVPWSARSDMARQLGGLEGSKVRHYHRL